MERYADQLNGSEDLFGLIVDGAALTLIMPFQENRNLFYQVALIYYNHSILVIADTELPYYGHWVSGNITSDNAVYPYSLIQFTGFSYFFLKLCTYLYIYVCNVLGNMYVSKVETNFYG